MKEGKGVAAKALKSLGVTASSLTAAVRTIGGPLSHTGSCVKGACPFSARVSSVYLAASKTVAAAKGTSVGTEDFVASLVAEGKGVGAKALSSLGVTSEKLAAAIKAVQSGRSTVPLSARAKRINRMARAAVISDKGSEVS